MFFKKKYQFCFVFILKKPIGGTVYVFFFSYDCFFICGCFCNDGWIVYAIHNAHVMDINFYSPGLYQFKVNKVCL